MRSKYTKHIFSSYLKSYNSIAMGHYSSTCHGNEKAIHSLIEIGVNIKSILFRKKKENKGKGNKNILIDVHRGH